MSPVPRIRIAAGNNAEGRGRGAFGVHWVTAFRPIFWNFALDRALEWAQQLQKPLVICEPLHADYPWASDRLHRFAIDGMADTAARLAALRNPGVAYLPYVEPQPQAEDGLLPELAGRACVVVTEYRPAP